MLPASAGGARTAAPPVTRREGLWLGVLVVALLASLPLLTHPWFEAKNDAGMFVLTARSMLAGEGYSLSGIPFQVRPPGFSALIAPVLAWFEGDFRALNLYLGAIGILGVLLLHRVARPRLGWPLAMVAAATVWMLPEYRSLCNRVLSDVPGLTLLLLCVLVERWAARVPSWRRDVVLGCAIGAAFYVRTNLVLLVPAIVAARLLQRLRPGRAAGSWRDSLVRLGGLAVAVLLVVLPWPIRNALNPPPSPVDQTEHYSYGTFLWHVDSSDPTSPRVPLADVARRVPERAAEVVHFLGAGLDDEPEARSAPLLALLLLVGLGLATLRHRDVPELFAVGLLASILLSPDFLGRHLLPVYVIAIVDTVELVKTAGDRAHPRAGTALGVAGLVALVAVDVDPRPRWAEVEREHLLLSRLAEEARPRLADDARIASALGWDYAVHLGRPVYNLLKTVQRTKDLASVEAVIDKYSVNTVVLSPRRNADKRLLKHFLARYPTPAGGAVHVFRVRDREP